MFLLDPKDTRVILIGASTFEDKKLPPLPAIKDNNVRLRALLGDVVGISKDDVHILEDRDYANQITSEISKIASKGLDIIYYAGHGLPHLKQLYLATKKTESDDPESSGALLADNLVRIIINKSKAKRIIFIFDCCFSGFARENIDTKGKEVFLLTATSSTETAKSESPENDNYTAFTHELLVILEQGIESAGEILTLQDIFTDLKERLENQNLPVPRITSYGSPNELGICQNRVYQDILLAQDKIGFKPIELYENLKQLNQAQFGEVCFYLREKYGYDLSYVDLNKAPSESANQLIEFLEQYSQELSYLSEVIDKVAPQKKSKINSPDLRPYLINRTDQKIQLRQEIRNHNKQYPLLCVIHGDKYQCHDRFFDRLVQYDLPKLTLASDNDIPCDFLSCRFDKGVDIWHQEILEKFSEKLFCSDNSSEIIDAIVEEKRSMLFYTSMCTDNWTQFGGMELVQEFIKFWADWSFPLHHNHLFLICLFFNYTVEPTNFLSRWRKKTSINEQIRQALKNLKFDEFGVKGIVLQELENIEKREVEDWVKEHLRDCLEIFQPEIDKLFKSSDEKKTMEYIVEKLNPILKEHCT